MSVDSILLELQTAVDNNGFSNIGKKTCTQTVDDTGIPEQCPHLSILIVGGVVTCSMQKTHTDPKKQERFCILHALQRQTKTESTTPLLKLMEGAGDEEPPGRSAMESLFDADADNRRRLFESARSRTDKHSHDHDHDDEEDEYSEEEQAEHRQAIMEAAAENGHVPFEPLEDKPTHCTCGQRIDAQLDPSLHDARHTDFVRRTAAQVDRSIARDEPIDLDAEHDVTPASDVTDELPADFYDFNNITDEHVAPADDAAIVDEIEAVGFGAEPAKRRGRPKKAVVEPVVPAEPKKRGRPRKSLDTPVETPTAGVDELATRRRGRPPKAK